MKKLFLFFGLVFMMVVIAACSTETTTSLVTTTETTTMEPTTTDESTTDMETTEDTIVGVAEANGSFTTLLAALDAANLTETLDSAGSYTVFAPTDAAFDALLAALEIDAATLLADPELGNILLYHVLAGEYLAADVVANAPFSMETLQGFDVDFSVMDGTAYINGVEIVTTDIETRNGVIHVIEEVILPEDTIVGVAEANGSFTTLLAALEEAGLTETLDSAGSYTVFAPTDAAFDALLAALEIDAATLLDVNNLSNILLYHVLSGEYFANDVVTGAPFDMTTLEGSDVSFSVMDGKAYINGVEIVTTDIETRNGVIHVIEEVILPLDNIVATADANGSFTTLLSALDTAGLTSTLEGAGSFTVFAPTDAAFDALATELDVTLNDILALTNLDQILLFHVINDIYYSSDVLAAAPVSLASMQGTNLDFTVSNNSIFINGTTEVIIENILTTNGIIHVISEVLLYE